MDEAEPFNYDGGRVDPGDWQNVRYTVSEASMGDPVHIPKTVVNGERPWPSEGAFERANWRFRGSLTDALAALVAEPAEHATS